jgi:Penicillin binding protein transpeptidase domain
MRGICVLLIPIALVVLAGAAHANLDGSRDAASPAPRLQSCFFLLEFGVGEMRRDPSAACRTRAGPASIFKIPHALAALNSGVIVDAEEKLTYAGSREGPKSSRRDHTAASAIRNSVVWHFQRVALRLGAIRETRIPAQTFLRQHGPKQRSYGRLAWRLAAGNTSGAGGIPRPPRNARLPVGYCPGGHVRVPAAWLMSARLNIHCNHSELPR